MSASDAVTFVGVAPLLASVALVVTSDIDQAYIQGRELNSSRALAYPWTQRARR